MAVNYLHVIWSCQTTVMGLGLYVLSYRWTFFKNYFGMGKVLVFTYSILIWSDRHSFGEPHFINSVLLKLKKKFGEMCIQVSQLLYLKCPCTSLYFPKASIYNFNRNCTEFYFLSIKSRVVSNAMENFNCSILYSHKHQHRVSYIHSYRDLPGFSTLPPYIHPPPLCWEVWGHVGKTLLSLVQPPTCWGKENLQGKHSPQNVTVGNGVQHSASSHG